MTIIGGLAVWLFMGWLIPERLKRRGLTEWEARRMAYEESLTRSSFWSRPAVAALLSEGTSPRADALRSANRPSAEKDSAQDVKEQDSVTR